MSPLVSLRRRVVRRIPEPALRVAQRVRHGDSPALSRPVARAAARGITPEVVRSFDVHDVRAEVVATVRRSLERARVPYVLVPGPRGTVRQVAVPAESRSAALAALASGLAGPGWALRPAGSRRQRAAVLRAFRVLAAPGGQVLCGKDTTCEIAFWNRVGAKGAPRPDGEPHLPGTYVTSRRNGVVPYLGPDAWAHAVAAENHWVDDHPYADVLDVTEPIDLVYTWVDDGDPTWRASRARFQTGDGHNASAAHASRYVNRDELRYSLRSVAMYASWVRTIHIVTDGQTPSWLDTSHPKINLLHHRDVFTDPSVLPVFNSHAIESQLHHIDGLAERYLYLNDDMFFGRPVEPELFFHGNGIAKFFLSPDSIDLAPAGPRDLPIITAAKNQRALIEAEFGVTVHRKFRHAAHAQLRSVAETMELRHPELFAAVAASRFRHPDDYSIPSSLQHYYAYALGKAVPGEWTYKYQDISKPDAARRLDEILRSRPQAFCLNDMDSTPDQLAEQATVLAQFFGEYFPLAAPWEKVTT